MPISTFEGKALVFNNGVVDVQQNGVSVVDENKIAHITTGGGGSGISEGRVNELIDIKIDELDIPHYTAGKNVTISSEGEISSSDKKAVWGSISGSILDQHDLFNELDQKANVDDIIHYSAGENITISSEGVISSTTSGGISEGRVNELIDIKIGEIDIPNYSAGNGISINSEGVISSKVTFTFITSSGELAIVEEV